MDRVGFLVCGCVVGLGIAWGFGLLADGTSSPRVDADAAAARLAELEAEIAALRERHEGATLEARGTDDPDDATFPPPGGVGPDDRPPDEPIISSRSRPFVNAPFGPVIPKDLPKELRGTPAMWIAALRAAVERGDHALARYFEHALVAVGKDARAPLLELITDGDESSALRTHALRALARVSRLSLPKAVAALLTDPELPAALKTQALGILAQSRPAEVPASVVEVARAETSSAVDRGVALRATMDAQPETASEILRDLLRGSDAQRAQAYEALQYAREAKLRPVLIEAIADAPANRRRGLSGALARLKGPDWGNEQMTGEPDTHAAGDHKSAWASLKAEDGLVTVELDFPEEVVPASLRVHETFNPGAVIKVEARSAQGTWRTVWTGTPAPATAPRWFTPALDTDGDRVRTFRLTLDTNAVKGWNEIDAVELIGEGRRQWASAARSSSCYAGR